MILLPLLPVPRLDDFRAGREAVHDVHPAGVRASIGERCLDELAVVEPGVAFQPVNVRPVLERVGNGLLSDYLFYVRPFFLGQPMPGKFMLPGRTVASSASAAFWYKKTSVFLRNLLFVACKTLK